MPDLRSEVIPALPSRCLDLEIGLEDIDTQERVSKLEFLLAFENIPRF